MAGPDTRHLACGLLILVLLVSRNSAGTARAADEQTAASLGQILAALRENAELAPLRPSLPLQELADRRAGQIAAAPAERRLPHPVPLDEQLDDWPELRGHLVSERVVVVPAALSGSDQIRAAWDNPEAGALALDSNSVAVGLGAWFSADGALILVALFQTEETLDRATLERVLVDEINEIRVTHGFVALTVNDRLREVARAHSGAMLADGFFGHESPDGSLPADRVRAARIRFRLIGENVARSLQPLGAIHSVVDEWMASPGHRANILTPDFRETAVGAVVSDDGSVYVTQLFREP